MGIVGNGGTLCDGGSVTFGDDGLYGGGDLGVGDVGVGDGECCFFGKYKITITIKAINAKINIENKILSDDIIFIKNIMPLMDINHVVEIVKNWKYDIISTYPYTEYDYSNYFYMGDNYKIETILKAPGDLSLKLFYKNNEVDIDSTETEVKSWYNMILIKLNRN